MQKRYSVFAEQNSFLGKGDQAPTKAFFAKLDKLPRKNGRRTGKIQSNGKKLRVSAEKVLGEDADFAITKLNEKQRLELLTMFPMLSIDEDVTAHMAMYQPPLLIDAMAAAGGPKKKITVLVTDENGVALRDVKVQLIFETTKESTFGAELTTDKRGRVVFPVPASRKTAQYVIAHPTHSYWPGTVTKLALTDGKTLTLQCHSIESRPNDSIDELFGSNPTDGAGVTVAIIDGGVGPHCDLALAAPGQTFVSPSTATTDNGVGHGTHVAGIIRRLAPAAKLLSYRVFPKDSMSTDGAFVAAAIRKAVRDGAQVINISLTFERDYPILQETLKLAQAQGVICVCAAGNNAGPVMPPARYAAAVAVAACGKKTWPKGSLDHELKKPAGKKQRSIFAATFTCFGPEVTLSAPGVGIVSTFPKNRRAVMSGTSMSAPVISGLLARSLSGNLRRSTAVGVARAVAATRSLVASAKLVGLRSGYEGHGVPFLR